MGNESYNAITNQLHAKPMNKEALITNLSLRKARVFDVGEIMNLVNSNAETTLLLPRGPKYLYENIRDFVVADFSGADTKLKIVGCGSLHILWKDIAEIRALAVYPQYRRCGIGSKMVRYLIEESRHMEIEKVYALTQYPEFFEKLGFQKRERNELPRRLWGECIKCPKYFHRLGSTV